MKLFKACERSVERAEIDLVDALLDLQEKNADLNRSIDGIMEACHSFEMYSLITDTIEAQGGVSKSLEMMFGENFSSVEAMKFEASQEAFEWAEKAWQWVKDFFSKLWNWCKSLFVSTASMKEKLEDLKKRANEIKYPVEFVNPFGSEYTGKNMEILDGYANFIEFCKKEFASETAESGFEVNADKLDELADNFLKGAEADVEGAGSNRHKINNASELIAECDFVIKFIDATKAGEEKFKAAEKEIEGFVKILEAKANKKGAFMKLQKITAKVGKIYMKMGNHGVRMGNMLLSAAKKDKAAKKDEPKAEEAPKAE